MTAMRKSQRNSQSGVGLLLVILVILVSVTVTGGVVLLITSTMRQSFSTRQREAAYTVAEGGINQTIFQMEAAMGDPANLIQIEEYLTGGLGVNHTGTKTFTGTVAGENYTVTLSDPLAGDELFQLDAVVQIGTSPARNLTAIVRGEPVEALNYALFGNYIHFDNHAKANFGLALVTSVYSNSGILVDKAVSITGPVQAVQYIRPNTGPASGTAGLPDTILNPAGEQGDPGPSPVVATAPVNQVEPAPKVKAFPSFDFAGVETIATAAGRNLPAAQFNQLLANAETYARTLGTVNTPFTLPAAQYPAGVLAADVPVSVIHHSSADPAQHRKVRIPISATPDQFVEVGSPDGVASGPDDTYEVIFEGDPLPFKDTVLFVNDILTIDLVADVLLRMEGALVVNGAFTLHAASEMLAWENRSAPYFVPLGQTLFDFAQDMTEVAMPNKDIRYSRYPAIAANGKIKIDKSAGGGPTHIAGVVYSVEESHLHRSEPRQRAYSVGSEIADVIHNCEFFSFAYDPEARNSLGFYLRLSGRPHLQIVRLEDR